MSPYSISQVSPDAKQVILSVNPKAGAGPADLFARRLCELLAERGFEAEILTDLAEVGARANGLHSEGRLRALVGAGGDGTAAELVNRTEPGVPITMIPTGTANLLARHFGMGRTPEAVCETVVGGKLLQMDAGRAADRIFLLMFSCGFDAEVVRRLHSGRSGHIRPMHYAGPIFGAMRGYRFPQIEVYCDETEVALSREPQWPLSAGWVFAFNLPCYAGGFRVTPDADGSDGQLDVCVFGRPSFWQCLRFVAAVSLRCHGGMRDCTTGRLRRFRISSPEPVPYQLDGDPGGMLPIEVEVLPGRTTLVVPAEYSAA